MGGSIQKLKQFVKNQKGFTLIELMAVLAILALILLIAVPAGGAMIEKAKKSADESSIALMEDAGEKAHVDKLPFDTDVINGEGNPEGESYKIPTLVEEGYLKLEEDSKFFAPENYVKKKNKGGEFIYKGIGSGDDTAGEPEAPAYAAIACEEAEALGYTCIYTADELSNIRSTPTGKFIMMNDIDLAKFAAWTPIGDSTTPFAGELNGNGYKITNLVMNQAASAAAGYTETNYGLFGQVSYGTFQNIVIADYKQTTTNRVSAAGLIGYYDAGSSRNPSGLPLVIKNVDITGSATNSGYGGGQVASLIGYVWNKTADMTIDDISFGGNLASTNSSVSDAVVSGLIGELDVVSTPAGRQMKVDITNIALNNVDLNANALAVGLVNRVNMDYTDAIFNISGVTMTGKLESGYHVAGLISQLNARDGKFNSTISNIKMGASLHSRGTVSSHAKIAGLIKDLYTNRATGSNTIENAVVSGALTAANPSGYANYIAGIVNLYTGSESMSTSANLTMQNIDVTSPITGDVKTQVAGAIVEYNPTLMSFDKSITPPKVTHTFKDINLTGDMTGGRVAGFINKFRVDGPNMDFSADGLAVTGALKGTHTSGLIDSYTSGNGRINQNITNVAIDSDMTASVNANGLIDTFYPRGTAAVDTLNLTFNAIDINGDLSGVQTSGVLADYAPNNGLVDTKFTGVTVNGSLSGTTVAGFASEFDPNNAPSQNSANKFLIDGFAVKGSTTAASSAAGLFGKWNNDTTNYTNYTGLKGVLAYTIQNVTLSGAVTVVDGATGTYGSVIANQVVAEKRDNTYLFKNIALPTSVAITNEQGTFKKGMIANPAATSTEFTFDNVK